MTFIIKHQTQPCATSCVSACMAMLADRPVQLVRSMFHKNYRKGDLSLGDMLREMCIPFTSFDTAEYQGLTEDGIYLVAVPSLNIRGGMHQVLVETLNGEWTVLDPNEGRAGTSYYTYVPNSDAHPLRVMLGNGYSVEAVVKHDELIKWRIADATSVGFFADVTE